MSKYISSDILMEYIEKLKDEPVSKYSFSALIALVPDNKVVNITLCENCYWSERNEIGNLICTRLSADKNYFPRDDDFCSYGKDNYCE